MKIEQISSVTLREKVYAQLKQKIISAEILPGEVMTLQGLADGFGVSLMPVREALRQLQSERVIVIESNKRIYVNALTAREVEEILRVRLVLETMAAKAACRLRSEDAVARTKRDLEAMEANLAHPPEYMRANSQFHFGIYGEAGSAVLLQLIDSLWARVGPYFVISSNEDQNHQAMRLHRGMWTAFAAKDAARMTVCLQGDLRRAGGIIMSLLQNPADDSAVPPSVARRTERRGGEAAARRNGTRRRHGVGSRRIASVVR